LNKPELLRALSQYSIGYPMESETCQQFLELLSHPRAFHRDHLPGHITGSAWVLNEDRTKVLLVHHAKMAIRMFWPLR
jgi:hypothetical protein